MNGLMEATNGFPEATKTAGGRTRDEESREWFKQTVRNAGRLRYASALSIGSSPAIATWFFPFFFAK